MRREVQWYKFIVAGTVVQIYRGKIYVTNELHKCTKFYRVTNDNFLKLKRQEQENVVGFFIDQMPVPKLFWRRLLATVRDICS